MTSDLDILKNALQNAGVAQAVTQTISRLFDPGPASAAETVYAVQAGNAHAATNLWRDLRAVTAQTVYYPVIVGRAADVETLGYGQGRVWTAASEVGQAANFDVAEWLAVRFEEMEADDEDDEVAGQAVLRSLIPEITGSDLGADGKRLFLDFLNNRAGEERSDDETTFPGDDVLKSQVARGYKPDEDPAPVLVALAPTTEGAVVPAFCASAAGNDCPPPHIHVAFFRRWKRLYGAEPFAVSGDVIEARLQTPPQTDQAALALALEQYLYCSDVVEQGADMLRELANDLKNSPSWLFWWD